MTLRAAIADDEPVALHRLRTLLVEAGWEVDAFEDGKRLLKHLHEHTADALFLDIQMPGLSGLEVLGELPDPPPPVIFVTAKSDYALAAFEHAAVDYLLKPVTADRLGKTLARLQGNQVPRRSVSELRAALPSPLPGAGAAAPPYGIPGQPLRFPVRAGEGKLLLELRKVTHFEVVDQVVWAHAGKQKFRTSWVSLAEVEAAFPGASLLRIQRHLLVRPEAVLGVRALSSGRRAVLVQDGVELEASRSAAHALKERLGI
jgi:two-component system LytT family response regulator/two-component system response regulator AlgR